MGNSGLPNVNSRLFAGTSDKETLKQAEKVINQLLAKKDWETLLELLKENPGAAEIRDKTHFRLPLCKAIIHQAPLELINLLIEYFPEGVVSKDGEGLLPIHFCIIHQNGPIVLKRLLDADIASAKEFDRKFGKLPIHLGMQNSINIDCFNMLINAYPDSVSRRTKDGKLCLHFAAEYSRTISLDIIKRLIELFPASAMEATGGRNALHFACENKASLDVIKIIYAAHEFSPREKGPELSIALHLAVSCKAPLEVVKFLLEVYPEGCEIRNRSGMQPLHTAIENNASKDIVMSILDCNPDLAKSKGKGGALLLHMALEKQSNHEVILRLLALYPQAAKEQDLFFVLPIRKAIKYNLPICVIFGLLEAYPEGASELDEFDRSALHYAASRNMSTDIMQALIDTCPDAAKVTDNNQQLPLHLCVKRGGPIESLKILLQTFPMGVNIFDKYNMTPLVHALEVGVSCQIVKALIKADPGIVMYRFEGKLMFHVALEFRRDLEIIETILSAHPDAARDQDTTFGRLPIHWGLKRKLPLETLLHIEKAYPFQESAFIKDNKGRLPIFYAIKYHAPFEIISMLLQINSKVVLQKDLPFYYKASDHFGEDPDALDENGNAVEIINYDDDDDDIVSSKNNDGDNDALNSDGTEVKRRIGNKQLIHYAAEDAMSTPQVIAELLKYTMPYSYKDLSYYSPHNFTWTYILSETNDRYAEAINIVLDLYVTVESLQDLTNVPNEQGIRSKDCATKESKRALLRRLFFYGRYELDEGPKAHESRNSIVRLAIDKSDVNRLVVLKFIRSKIQFHREVERRAQTLLSEEYVIPVIRNHDGDLDEYYVKEIERMGLQEFPYCLVMAAAERNFLSILIHEYFVGDVRNWDRIRDSAKEILIALNHIHERGLIHGDVKPLNIMREKYKLKFIDLGACVSVARNELAGSAKTSSAYLPPEMMSAEVMFVNEVKTTPSVNSKNDINTNTTTNSNNSNNNDKSNNNNNNNSSNDTINIETENIEVVKETDNKAEIIPAIPVPSSSIPSRAPESLSSTHSSYKLSSKTGMPVTDETEAALESVNAHYSIDVWSFGALFYHMCTGEPLWLSTVEDEIDNDQKRLLFLWSDELKAKKLSKVSDIVAKNLLTQLLSKDIRRRPPITTILQHNFFTQIFPSRIPGMTHKFDICLVYRRKKKRKVISHRHAINDDDEEENENMDYTAIKKIRMKNNVEDDDERVDAFKEILEKANYSVCDCYDSIGKVQEGFGTNMIQSKSVIVILSRHAVNFKTNSFENLQEDSAYDHMLFQIRLARELELLELLEGGISVVAIGDKIQPISSAANDGDDYNNHNNNNPDIGIERIEMNKLNENDDHNHNNDNNSDNNKSSHSNSNNSKNNNSKSNNNNIESNEAVLSSSEGEGGDAGQIATLSVTTPTVNEHEREHIHEYGTYFESYRGDFLGRYGGCHPNCPKVVVKSVENVLRDCLIKEGLGEPIVESKNVLDIMNEIISRPIHHISNAWDDAVKFYTTIQKQRADGVNVDVSHDNDDGNGKLHGDASSLIGKDCDEDLDSMRSLDDDGGSVVSNSSDKSKRSMNSKSTANKGKGTKKNKSVNIAGKGKEGKGKGKGNNSKIEQSSSLPSLSTPGKSSLNQQSKKNKDNNTVTTTTTPLKNTKINNNNEKINNLYQPSDDHATNVATIRLLHEKLDLKDVELANMQVEIELMKKQLDTRIEENKKLRYKLNM